MSEPLLLIPGMMCDARIFQPQINDFSRSVAVHVAAPVHGDTIRDMARCILDGAPARFALAGVSMGGIVAMEIMRQASEQVTRLALISTTPLAETPAQAAWREPQIAKARAGALDEAIGAALAPENLAPGPGRNQVLALMQDMAQGLGSDLFVTQSRALQRRRDAQKVLLKCAAPTLVLCGAHDRLTPVARHQSMADLLPDSRLEVIEEAGHLPSIETPGRFNDILRDWLAAPLLLR